MQLLLIGLNHTTAPLAVRERVAFSENEIRDCIVSFKERLGGESSGALSELMILSTCNRTEFYCACTSAEILTKTLSATISEQKSVSASDFMAHCYVMTGLDVARHLYSVVSGIDSMVLGETQIVGQFKKAVAIASEVNGLGLYLNHLLQNAYSVAKLVRTKTAIGANSVSLAAAAVRLTTRIFGELTRCNVLFIGAGEMIELCAAHFGAQKPRSVTVANRTLEKGAALAKRYGGNAIRLQELPEKISQFDVVVSCTASSLPIIGLGMIERAIRQRRHKPMCIVDLAVPRDVEAEIARLDDVYVYSMDELGAVVQSGKESRLASVKKAESIISTEVEKLQKWLAMREVVPTISLLRERAERIKTDAQTEALETIRAGLSAEEAVKKLANTLTNKLIHDPTLLLRNAGDLTETERQWLLKVFADFYSPRGL